MSRLVSRGREGQNLRHLLLLGLVIGSAYSIYLYGVKVGSQQDALQHSLLLSSQPAEAGDSNKYTETGTGGVSLPIVSSRFVLGIPEGEAKPLPSIRHDNTAIDKSRLVHGTQYGGAGDKPHLGGFTEYDGLGVSPSTWKYMMSYIGVKSLMDVGCGKGVSTLYFAEHGADVLCVEGSHDAVQQTFLPDPEHQIVEHDFSRGPYWPAKTYDAVWAVEFLEHVGRNYHFNYIQAFRKAALIFVSHSRWGGWHHVEVHKDEYWMSKFQMFGFQYSKILTEQIKKIAEDEWQNSKKAAHLMENQGPDGKYYNGQHIWLTMMVFINPVVAALPEHAHLMAEPGCYVGREPKDHSQIVRRDCEADKQESVLPDAFKTLEVTEQKHYSWLKKVRARVLANTATEDA